MTNLLTSELIDRCHAGSKAKGFWDEIPPQGQQLMLVISELAEALEADRKGKRTMNGCLQGLLNTIENVPEYFETRFVANVKDTVEDELADAYIRLCDFAGGFKLDIDALIATENEWYDLFAGAGCNLGEALLSISYDVAAAWVNESETLREVSLGTAMAELRTLADRQGIDLATHIDLKLRYNATRPAKHGKAY
jgi:hypothetical protein